MSSRGRREDRPDLFNLLLVSLLLDDGLDLLLLLMLDGGGHFGVLWRGSPNDGDGRFGQERELDPSRPALS